MESKGVSVSNPLAIYEHFAPLMEEAQTLEQVNELFILLSKPLGVTFFACACVQGAYSDPERSRMLGYNDTEWMKYYMDNEFWRDDPIFIYGKQARSTFTFTEALQNMGLNERARKVMLDGEKFGIKEGFAIPLRSSEEHLAIFSMGGMTFPRERGQLHLAAIWAHNRALELLDRKHQLEKLPITTKEYEVVSLEAEGWTPDEIADRMGISIDTVHKHRQSARKKTGARTNVQLGALLRSKRIIN